MLGYYYMFVHYVIMLTCAVVLVASTNVLHLLGLLNVLLLDGFAVLACRDCPLTLLEKRRLNGASIVGNTKAFYRRMCGTGFACDHTFETTLEFLVNMASLVLVKLGVLGVAAIF